MKKCTECLVEKEENEFGINANNKSLRVSKCRKCVYQKYKDYNKEWRARNRDWVVNWNTKWWAENGDKAKARHREWLKKNKERVSEYGKKNRWKYLEKKKEADKKRSAIKREATRIRNLTKVRRSPMEKRLASSLRSTLYCATSEQESRYSAIGNLGCSIKELMVHLEKSFYEDMSWDDYGFRGWHIDHIKPLSKFDLTDIEEFKKACHYTNLQPLWWIDNARKHNKYEEPTDTN